jgi:predicted ATPase
MEQLSANEAVNFKKFFDSLYELECMLAVEMASPLSDLVQDLIV